MPWRALEWTEMKSLMNLKAFRTLNRYHISKIRENSSDSILVTTPRARTVLVLENANKFLIKLAPKLILHFEALVLFQVTLDQRVLKLNLCSKVQSASIFHKEHFGDHVVHAKPSAEAIKSCEI